MPVDMEMGLSQDFYEDSAGPYLQVATVVKSKCYCLTNFEGAPATADIATFKLLSSSDPETLRLWAKVKEHEPKDVFLWCDFLLVGLDIF